VIATKTVLIKIARALRAVCQTLRVSLSFPLLRTAACSPPDLPACSCA
jgi:hypothetical protein